MTDDRRRGSMERCCGCRAQRCDHAERGIPAIAWLLRNHGTSTRQAPEDLA